MSELHRSTPAELKARLEAERRGTPFLLFFDGAGSQVLHDLAGEITVGRGADCDVALGWDREVSRLHAQLERVGGHWVLVDDGLSRNGSFVNGERVVGRRRLRDGDLLGIGRTTLQFRAPAGLSQSTLTAGAAAPPRLTPGEHRVLVALCRPLTGPDSAGAPATNREIGAELQLSIAGVKTHVRALFAKLGIDDLPQYRKRVELVRRALESGVVGPG